LISFYHICANTSTNDYIHDLHCIESNDYTASTSTIYDDNNRSAHHINAKMYDYIHLQTKIFVELSSPSTNHRQGLHPRGLPPSPTKTRRRRSQRIRRCLRQNPAAADPNRSAAAYDKNPPPPPIPTDPLPPPTTKTRRRRRSQRIRRRRQ
jgi:hypothetical protein